MAGQPFTMQHLAARLAQTHGISQAKADAFVRIFFSTLKEALWRDRFVKINGLGTFKLVMAQSRESIDVNTGSRIEIAEHLRLVFTPAATMKARVNRPFESFDTIIYDENEIATIDSKPDEQPDDKDMQQPEQQPTEQPQQEVAVLNISLTGEPAPAADSETDDDEATVAPTDDAAAEQAETLAVETISLSGETPSDTTADDESNDDNNDDDEEEGGRTWWKWVVAALLWCATVAAAYWAGYQKLIPLETTPPAQPIAEEVAEPDSMQQATPTAEPQQPMTKADSLRMEAQNYEQMDDADYLIAGTQEIHIMKAGDQLLKLARQTYGHHNFAKYIVFYNKLERPDVVPLGYELKLPILIARSEEEQSQQQEKEF